MDLSIIIVNWNTADLTENCLASIYSNPPEGEFEVWVVDNASTDDSVKKIKSRFPQVRLIENSENNGFGRANNQAIERAAGKYIELLNSDALAWPGTFSRLINFMEDNPRAGACGSMYKNPDGSLQTSCYPFPTLLRELWRLLHLDSIAPFGVYRMSDWNQDSAREVDVLQGASLFLRKSALEKVGAFDPDYFMYTEEVDLCYRLKKAGWSRYWIPSSVITHFGGQSTRLAAGEMFIRLYQSKIIFFRKQYGKFPAFGYKLILAFTSLIRLAISPFVWVAKPKERMNIGNVSQNYMRLLKSLLNL